MKKFFYAYGDGFPFFIYYISLFVTTGYFTVLCGNIYSCSIFLLLSVLYLTTKHGNRRAENKQNETSKAVFNILASSSMVISVFAEIGIAVKIFNLASDADSGKAELSVFAAIICVTALLAAVYGITALGRVACFGGIIPFLILVPIASCFIKYGMGNIMDIMVIGDLGGDILKGTAAFLLLVSDIGIVHSSFASERSCDPTNASLWTRAATVYIILCSLMLTLLFGKNITSELSSALMSCADAAGSSGTDEILLIIFSFCLVLRLSMKMIFISKRLREYFLKGSKCMTVTFIITSCAALSGAFFTDKNDISVLITVQAILNAVSFIAVPYLSIYARKK